MKVYANENLEEMSFISVNFSTLFYKRNRKLFPHIERNSRICQKNRLPPRILCTAHVSFKLSLYFFHLQAALVTNALIPTSIFVSYYCRVPTARKVRLRFHLIVVGAPKLQLKDDNADFQVFLSEKWKLSNNRQTSDYALTIGRLPIIEKLPIIGRLIGQTD